MQKLETMATLALATAALAACASVNESGPTAATPTEAAEPEATPVVSDDALFINWTKQPINRRWYVSNHNMPSGQPGSDFRHANVQALPNGLNIKLAAKSPINGQWPWASGEVQYRPRVSFGEYHTIMRAAPGENLVSAFFSYTGPYYGNPRDEIDVEFSGRSPFRIRFNTFTDGVSHGGINYPVEFDTTKNFALYSFTWTPDRVTWYVNGEFAHEITSNDYLIPQTPGILFAHMYRTRNQQQNGSAELEEGATATFRCMSYRPLGDTNSRTCADEWNAND